MDKKSKISLNTAIHGRQEVFRVGFDCNQRVIDEFKAKTAAVRSANPICSNIPENKFVKCDFLAEFSERYLKAFNNPFDNTFFDHG